MCELYLPTELVGIMAGYFDTSMPSEGQYSQTHCDTVKLGFDPLSDTGVHIEVV